MPAPASFGWCKVVADGYPVTVKLNALELSAREVAAEQKALDAQGAMDAGMHAVWLNRGQVAWPCVGAEPHVTVASLWQLCQGLADR